MAEFIEIKFAEGTDGHTATIRIDRIDAIMRPVLGAPTVVVNGHLIKVSEDDAEKITAALKPAN